MKILSLATIAIGSSILFAALAGCDKRSAAGQEAGDILNPDGRRREASVAREATETARAATETARQANEMAQSNLDAAKKARADAEKTVADAKREAAKAEADLKAKEKLFSPEQVRPATPNSK